jgi:predicted MFS family arabinose efflux permease
VLGYSPLQAGLTTAVMTVMSIFGSFAGQAAVTRFGLRPIAVVGTLLIIGGSLLLTGVTPSGGFATHILPAMLIFGAGVGAAFIACQIAALTGVREDESGLAAGLVDTSFHLGNAVGIAISTSVAVSVATAVHLANPAADPLVAQTDGLRTAFAVTVGSASIALIAALTLLPGRTATVVGS